MMSFDKKKMIPLKAVMALLIVADHLTFYMDAWWLRPFRELGAPIVSMFFFISGYGLSKSYAAKGKAYLDSFFRRRIWKVILPALIALVFYYILLWDPARPYGVEWRNLILHGVPVLPHSWFVVAIVAFYLGFYVSYNFLPDRWKIWGVLSGTLVWMAVTLLAGYDWCWWISSLAFPTGLFFARYEQHIYAFCERCPRNYLLLVGALILAFLALYLTRNEYIWTLCYVLIPLIVALIIARLPLERMNWRWLAFIAGISYEIYLCQGIPMMFFQQKVVIQQPVLYVVTVYLTVIVLASIVHYLSQLKCLSPAS